MTQIKHITVRRETSASGFRRPSKAGGRILQRTFSLGEQQTKRQRRLRVRSQAELARLVDKLVATRIRTFRIDRGLTQQLLGEKVGVASQQIHKYESGISRVTAGRLLQIAEALEYSLEEFFDFRGELPREVVGKKAAV